MWLTVWSAGRIGNQFLGEACIPLGPLDLTDPGEQWYQLHDFVETGVILPSSSSSGRHSRTSPTSSLHRTRANAFSRSSTPSSRRGSIKSTTSGSHEAESPAPAAALQPATNKPIPHQLSVDSDAVCDQHMVIPQGEKRGSADSIIPVITIDYEQD